VENYISPNCSKYGASQRSMCMILPRSSGIFLNGVSNTPSIILSPYYI
jgi:hypothetical protein